MPFEIFPDNNVNKKFTQYLWPLFNNTGTDDFVHEARFKVSFKIIRAPVLIMSCHVRGSCTLIFIIWVFSHSSVDYTVSYSIKKKGWLIQYIDLQLEPNIYFSEFPRRSITSNLNNGCRWPRRVEETDRGQKADPSMIRSSVYHQTIWSAAVYCVSSNNGTDRICRTVEMGWSAQNIYSQIVTEWNRVKGCVWWDPALFVTKQSPDTSTSFKINADKQCDE